MDINMETVQRVLQGSKNIDRMREEVEFLVRMIIGLVHASSWGRIMDKGFDSGQFTFKSDDCDWIISFNFDRRGCHPSAKCFLHPSNYMAISYVYDEMEREPLPFWKVKETHSSLPVFLKGMIETFPEVGKMIQLFLEASKVQF